MSTKPSPSRTDPSQPAVTAYIALGANLGDRDANLRAAIQRIGESSDTAVVAVSGFLENPAVGGPVDAPPFINAVAELKTTLSAVDLLRRLLEIERGLGRARRERWEPRIIDLDLLLYSDQIIQTQELTVPHPLMHQRKFVLTPLAEIAPSLLHPVLGTSIRELALA